jgi:hypothetical protein
MVEMPATTMQRLLALTMAFVVRACDDMPNARASRAPAGRRIRGSVDSKAYGDRSP